MSKKFDRGINPHDGSRRRLKSVEHKSKKDYNRNKFKLWEEWIDEHFPEKTEVDDGEETDGGS